MLEKVANLGLFDVETDANRGARLELMDKFGKKSGEWILLLGTDSREAQAKLAEAAQARVTRAQRGDRTVTLEQVREERCSFLAALTREWSFKTQDGAALPCDAANAYALYRASSLIREQVDEFVSSRANFLPG